MADQAAPAARLDHVGLTVTDLTAAASWFCDVFGLVRELGVRVEALDLSIEMLIHPAFGYRVDYAGHSVVLSGDTRYSENLIRFSQGVDVLIHEVLDPEAYRASDQMYSPEQKQKVINHHTTPEQAGTVFSQVKPKLAVYSHVVPFNVNALDLVAHTRKTYAGPLEVGEDLMSIEIGEKIEVHSAPK